MVGAGAPAGTGDPTTLNYSLMVCERNADPELGKAGCGCDGEHRIEHEEVTAWAEFRHKAAAAPEESSSGLKASLCNEERVKGKGMLANNELTPGGPWSKQTKITPRTSSSYQRTRMLTD